MDFIDLKTQQKLIRKSVEERMLRVLDHGQYIMGPEIEELEKQLADFVNVKHCISNASGTDALLLALMALGISSGDEVITTPFTFFATGEVIALLGARPVMVDIDKETYNIDPKLVEKAITPRTKAIIPVSLYGLCADLEAINKIASVNGIAVIEDGAQSFGATIAGKKSCGLTTIGCSSFFPSKPLGGYGDSGACFTDDDDLARKMKEIRIHGQEKRYHHTHVGINGRMDTLQAAILLEKLKLFPQEVELRFEAGRRYNMKLANNFKLQKIPQGYTSVYAQYTIEVQNRDNVQKKLQELGIPTAVHYPIPMHLQPAFDYLGLKKGSFPVCEEASAKVMSLPMHPYLEDKVQDKIVSALLTVTN